MPRQSEYYQSPTSSQFGRSLVETLLNRFPNLPRLAVKIAVFIADFLSTTESLSVFRLHTDAAVHEFQNALCSRRKNVLSIKPIRSPREASATASAASHVKPPRKTDKAHKNFLFALTEQPPGMVEDTMHPTLPLGQVLQFLFQEGQISSNLNAAISSGLSILAQLAANTIPNGIPSTRSQIRITSGIFSSDQFKTCLSALCNRIKQLDRTIWFYGESSRQQMIQGRPSPTHRRYVRWKHSSWFGRLPGFSRLELHSGCDLRN